MKHSEVVVTLIDDLDGSSEAKTISFGLDGQVYEMELGEKNEAKLRKFLAPYIESARTKGRRSGANGAQKGGKANSRSKSPDPAKVREWAAGQGIEVAGRGRIPKEIVDQYKAR